MDTRLQFLADRMGAFVTIDGKSYMLVAVRVATRGSWAIFEGEDGQVKQLPLVRAIQLVGPK